MSSINPVFILPGVLAQRSTELGRSLAASVLLGVGQFCTNPGVVFGIASKYWELFRQETAAAMASAKATTMLHSGIARAYEEEALRLTAIEGVEILARGEAGGMETGEALLCGTTAATFLLEPGLAQEVFGPCTVLVTCDSFNQMLQVATQLEGQLTCTIHFAEEGENADPGVQADQVADASMVRTLLPILQTKAGRPMGSRPALMWAQRWCTVDRSLLRLTVARLLSGPWQSAAGCARSAFKIFQTVYCRMHCIANTWAVHLV
jgi:alpha-ketoglutaric semialdehyde dehydrogenase